MVIHSLTLLSVSVTLNTYLCGCFLSQLLNSLLSPNGLCFLVAQTRSPLCSECPWYDYEVSRLSLFFTDQTYKDIVQPVALLA